MTKRYWIIYSDDTIQEVWAFSARDAREQATHGANIVTVKRSSISLATYKRVREK